MKKPDIMILHGWNLYGSRFAPLATVLEEAGYRVYTPDLPGFGEEAAPKRAWHVVDYAEFVHQYMKKNRIREPVVIGHSFGGRVALKLAQLYPDSVTSLVLTGTPGFSPVPKKRLLFFLLLAKIGGFVFSIPPLTFFADWARRWLYYVAGAREFLRATGSMRQTFKNVVQDDLSDAMESVRVPVLLVWGEYDVIVPVAIARRMAEVIPQSELYVIPEADHGVPFKDPKVFSGYARRFLEKKHAP